ncbi:MAG TPA: hypothetical protein VEF04_21715, partial [Blastocatellia bacterium]|nr:hypothetical protein [Blastocatellia bacterium]
MQEQPAKVEVQWGTWFNEGWQMFAERWQVWVLHMLVFIAAIAIVVIPMYFVIIISAINSQGRSEPEFPTGLILFYVFFYPYVLLISAYLAAGCYHTAIKQLRGEPISFGDIFGGGRYFLRMLGATLLFALATMIGAFLCFIPAFLAMGLFFFTFPLV